MSDRLLPILAEKRLHVERRKAVISVAEIQRRAETAPPAKGFARALA